MPVDAVAQRARLRIDSAVAQLCDYLKASMLDVATLEENNP